jgi:hypothetical protein
MSEASDSKKKVLVGGVLALFCLSLALLHFRSAPRPAVSTETESPPEQSSDPLTAGLPQPDPAAQLRPSPLNALLKPNLSPQAQVEIVAQVLLDYWVSVRSLPAGTWDEVYAALGGKNSRSLAFAPKEHPALGPTGFRSAATGPSIRLRVVSSREGNCSGRSSTKNPGFLLD